MPIQRWLPLMLLLVATTTHAQAAPTDSAQVEATSTEDAVPPPPTETTAPTETAAPTVQAEARTQPADVSVRSDEPQPSGAAYQQAVEAGVGVRLELDGINHQQDAANALYVTSTILAVLGTGSIVGGVIGALSSFGGSSSSGSSTGVAFVYIGAALNIGHVVTMVIAACLDYGSGSHRRKFLHDHPEFAFELTPGPGDAGLGLALHF